MKLRSLHRLPIQSVAALTLSLLSAALLSDPPVARGQPQATEFVPSPTLELAQLMDVVRDRAPALQQDHLEVELRQADARQSRLFDNPVLDGAVGTIPVGPANPPELPDPLRNIPNYSIGLSLHLDLARRGPRIRRAERQIEAAQAGRDAAVRAQALTLLRLLGDVALATLRMGADRHLAQQSRSALTLARDRVRTGYGPPLDADRAEIELLRLEQQVAADQGDLLAAQAACAQLLGMRCAAFASDDAARQFLLAWVFRGEVAMPSPETRPDLVALAAQEAAARADERLAHMQWVPDPTLRVGYTYDQFIASGNQQQSMTVGMTLPLSLSDHGQAAAQAARARAQRFANQRALSLQSAQARSEALRLALQTQRQRLALLQQQVVPRAQAIVSAVRRAFEARAVPLTDLNQAQRALDELQLQEASALLDVFRLSVDLIEQGGPHV